MTWLVDDFKKPALCPLTGVPGNRSGEALTALVALFHVDTAERYRRRDVTGDDKAETFCNVFVSDVTRALGCPVPHLLANQQLAWLAKQRDWWRWRRWRRLRGRFAAALWWRAGQTPRPHGRATSRWWCRLRLRGPASGWRRPAPSAARAQPWASPSAVGPSLSSPITEVQ